MAITLDPATQNEYLVGATVVARAQGVVAAFTGTVTCKIYDGSDVEKAAATFDSPWASASGETITIGEVGKLIVSDGGTPDDNWYVEISNGTRWLRGTFGLLGSGKDFTWSASTFATGQQAELGTVTLTASVPVTTSAPSNTAVPVINGTPQVGQVLSVTDGTWSGSPTPTYTYQWNRDGADLSGETAATYTLVSADEGAMIGARVTATNSAGSASASATAVGPITPFVAALSFSGLPSTIPIYQGSTFALASYVSGGVTPYTYSYTGMLPTGVTLDSSTGVLSASASATLGTSGSIVFNVDDSASVASLPTFGVTSAVGGTNLPFAFGHAFKQGDVPAGSYVNSDLADWQCFKTTEWPDGSLRHAIIAGRATCSANVLKSIALSVSATNRSGAALTETDLAAAMPTTTIVAGGDSFTLNSLVGTAAMHRQVCSGPVMSNWLYRRQIAGSNHLVAWFDVRLYKGGAVEIFPWMENAYLTVANPVNDVRTYTLTIGGVQRFTQSIDIKHHTRIPLVTGSTFSYWTGTDPQITPKHDVAYLRATKMVPNYGWTNPSAATLNGLQQTYTPNTLAGISSNMGNAGTSASIISTSQALYVTSGDARAWRALVVYGLSGGSWSIHTRAEASSTQGVAGAPNEPVRFADYPTYTLSNSMPSGSGGTNGSAAITHQYSFGYLTWLLTGRWFFLEEQLFWAGWNFLCGEATQRRGEAYQQATGTYPAFAASGTAGIIDPNNGCYTVRGAAWSLRGLAQALAILPETHPCFASYKNAWEKNAQFWRAKFVDGTYWTDEKGAGSYVSPLGIMGQYTNYAGGGSGITRGEGWQQGMLQQVWGFASQLSLPQSTAADVAAVVGHGLKLAAGLAGDSSNWNYRRFTVYSMYYASNEGYPVDWVTTFKAAFDGQEAVAGLAALDGGTSLKKHTSDVDMTGNDGDSSWPYFGQQFASLAYAVDAGVAGASAGYGRVTAASNYATVSSYFNDDPCYGIVPRTL